MRSEGCRVGSVGRSPIRFFDPILNNALALRASQYHILFWQHIATLFTKFDKCDDFHKLYYQIRQHAKVAKFSHLLKEKQHSYTLTPYPQPTRSYAQGGATGEKLEDKAKDARGGQLHEAFNAGSAYLDGVN